ncbi:MAG: Csu type fimbrial protein [Polaromonas sp.]
MLFKKTLLAVAALAFVGVAGAATATANFQVLMKINKACTVTAGSSSNIQIGAVAGVDSNSGSNNGTSNISVTCSKTTPYNIGLLPSNTNTAGAGVMAGTSGNTDTVPYQLNSGSATGPVWGNTATATVVGNGVAGVGNGSAQTIPVFATAPSANFTPDSYTDTVTVTVNY